MMPRGWPPGHSFIRRYLDQTAEIVAGLQGKQMHSFSGSGAA